MADILPIHIQSRVRTRLKLLLTDVTSPLGRALEHELERESFTLMAPGAKELDWRDRGAVVQYLRLLKPDVIINNLGWAEEPDEAARGLLVDAAANLAVGCSSQGFPLVHVSSYRVFGSDNKSVHGEKDEPTPPGPVGQAFLDAEQHLRASLARCITLRYSWLIGGYGDNRLTRLLDSLFRDQPVTASTRLRGAPTALSDAARVAVAMAKQIVSGAENWGVMHYCSGDACSEAEFAEQVIQTLRQQELLRREVGVTLTELLPDQEPVSAVLSCRRVRDNFGVQTRSWRPSLLPMIKQWVHSHAPE